MNGIIIYRSKTGFSARYANWIAEELNLPCVDSRIFDWRNHSRYDVVIYGGGLYQGGINGLRKMKRWARLAAPGKFVVFACGATPMRDETTRELFQTNFSERERAEVHFFYLRGGFHFAKLGMVDRILMILLKWKLRLKSEALRSPDEKGMLQAYERYSDFSTKKHIAGLLECCRQP